ncbi:MAG: hypothetical protein GY765_14230 [bacterium]|nr:hypothetical protein [bacterium]
MKDPKALEKEIIQLRSEKAALQVQSRLLENFVNFARSSAKERVMTRLLQKTLEISAELTGADKGSLFLLNADGAVTDGILTLSVSYNEKEFDKENIAPLVVHYKSRLQQIIDFCIGREESELTLSDFSSTEMDNEDMEAMFDVLTDKFGE